MTSTSLDSALATFDLGAHAGYFAAGASERASILERFPLADWPTLPLERYALGTEVSAESFCRWLEFRSLALGSIKGGSSFKHLIYRQIKSGAWWFRGEYADETAAWAAIRAGFVQAFDLARRGAWDRIGDIEALQGAAALKAKALHVYFPDEVLPVFSHAHIRHFLRLLGDEVPASDGTEAVELGRRLLARLREHPGLRGLSTTQLGRFLYTWAHPRESRRVVKIAPGEAAMFWDECLAGSYICVGWGGVGDLSQFEDDKAAFKARYDEVYAADYPHKPKQSAKANELWTLAELEPGDIVIANRGTSHVLAVGEVIDGGYEWRPERERHRHTVKVKWDTSYAQDIAPVKGWATVTVAKVPPALYEQILQRRPGNGPPAPPDPLFAELADALDRKGQAILYGPPGTGKTYSARRFAIHWLLAGEGNDDPAAVLVDRAQFAATERRLSVGPDGAIAPLTRITFHPSYSYEDFVEGFRPVKLVGGGLNLELVDGVFKRVCLAAQARPKQRFLVLIDEINRANVAKVFGELITLLEKDKRGMVVVLPQSRDSFAIPENVFVLGTMNTADRSIKLLDAALRRRFAFLECMPNPELLRGATVGELDLEEFLTALNRRIVRREGREKQIGHSFLLDGITPVTEPEEFARRFRHEILPLLQEYCYADYATLADYLGGELVDRDDHTLDEELLALPDRLVAALARELTGDDAGNA